MVEIERETVMVTTTSVRKCSDGSCGSAQPQSDGEEEMKLEAFGFVDCFHDGTPKRTSSSHPQRRSELFRALNCEDDNGSNGKRPKIVSTGSLPDFSDRNISLSRKASYPILEGLRSGDTGEFRSCRHCASIFPYMKSCASSSSPKTHFCSGECWLTFVTLQQKMKR